MIDYVEQSVGCKLSDIGSVVGELSDLEKLQDYLQSHNVSCKFIVFSSGKSKLYYPLADKEKMMALIKQFKNKNQKRDNNQNIQLKKPVSKKPKPRL